MGCFAGGLGFIQSAQKIWRAPTSAWCRHRLLVSFEARPTTGQQNTSQLQGAADHQVLVPHGASSYTRTVQGQVWLGSCLKAQRVSKLPKGDLIGTYFLYILIFQENNPVGSFGIKVLWEKNVPSLLDTLEFQECF